jgi:hypothetical protein
VTLVTGSQGDGTNYTLTVNNVQDITGNTIGSPNSKGFTGTGPVDTTPPQLLSALLVDGNTVEVRYSEPVDQLTSENAGNYTIVDSFSNPVTVSAVTRQTDISKVWVDIGGYFSKSSYDVTVSTSVEDLNGNFLVGPPSNTVFFAGQSTTITDAVAISNTSVKVTFSNDVEQSAAETVSNYSIPGLTVSNAVRDGGVYAIVYLTTSAHEDVNYTLTVTGFIEQDSKKFAGDVSPYLMCHPT